SNKAISSRLFVSNFLKMFDTAPKTKVHLHYSKGITAGYSLFQLSYSCCPGNSGLSEGLFLVLFKSDDLFAGLCIFILIRGFLSSWMLRIYYNTLDRYWGLIVFAR